MQEPIMWWGTLTHGRQTHVICYAARKDPYEWVWDCSQMGAYLDDDGGKGAPESSEMPAQENGRTRKIALKADPYGFRVHLTSSPKLFCILTLPTHFLPCSFFLCIAINYAECTGRSA